MSDFLQPNNEFLRKIISIIEENIADELFGVSELAERINMSRSNLLRKVKTLTNSSVSVFIRKVRLHHAKELLKEEELTASEISYKVGFSSTSYFTKCFREEFGYTPGEEKKNKPESEKKYIASVSIPSKRKRVIWILLVLITAILIAFYVNNSVLVPAEKTPDKSIAVLPFKNDSNDSSNVYIINGLMEAILDNLQKVEDLKVTSRTSVEKYRNSTKTIPELSKELEVSYFVEGSGQKIGNKIVLSVQLIDGTTDRHVWSRRYERELDNIFQLQAEVAKNIAKEVEALITPEEQKRIEKIPTKNIAAYDYYLKGIEFTKKETNEGLTEAIIQFKKAIEEDNQFAAAYAYIAICYYYQDIFLADKKYSLEIKSYADRALQIDSELVEGLVAKALFYMQDANYSQAITYFEKALEVNPNSGRIHNFLTDIYNTSYSPNTRKYLKHALLGIKSAVADQDSVTASFSYLHLSNALVQSGFVKEAKNYVEKSLNYNPDNLYSEYLYVYIKLAEDFNLERTKDELIATLQKDTTRLDILQEIGKVCYTMEEYEEAWKYYNKYIRLKEMYQLNIYPAEDVKIAFVLEQLGRNEEAEVYYKRYKEYVEQDASIYKSLIKCVYYASQNDIEAGMSYFKEFTKQKEFMYWIVLFLDKDPIINKLSDHPDYKQTLKKISDNFWIQHQSIREMLDEEGVI